MGSNFSLGDFVGKGEEYWFCDEKRGEAATTKLIFTGFPRASFFFLVREILRVICIFCIFQEVYE